MAHGAVITPGPNDACTALEKIAHASDFTVKGEIGLGSCANEGITVIFPIDAASERDVPSKRSEYFSATGWIRL